jgi:hypothetical protein
MTSTLSARYDEDDRISRDQRIFLNKVARSVAEIQPDLYSLADIEVFLEVLGYTKGVAIENGFEDLSHLSRCLYEFVDYYADSKKSKAAFEKALVFPRTGVGRRVAHALGLAFPWIGSLAILFVFGVSLWLAWGLPLSVTTLFIAGVFIGLFISEGPVQVFNRLFTFYYNQSNLPEVRRLLERSYLMSSLIVASAVASLYAFGLLEGIPTGLLLFTVVGTATISLHRVSYVAIYSLKKVRTLVLSFALAFVALLSVYTLSYDLIPYTPTRYIVSLVSAVIVLSIAPAFVTYKIFSEDSISPLEGARSPAASPLIVNKRTIRSRFTVQLWETAPFYLFGTFSVMMLFGDRLVSWVFNPTHLANGIGLPFVFNAVYEIGADVALLVLFPVTIVQYVVMTPVFGQLSNLAVTSKTTEAAGFDRFLVGRYRVLLAVSLAAAGSVAMVLFFFAPEIVSRIGGSVVTVQVMRVAAVGDLFMVLFATNGAFMIFLNRVKSLALTAMVGASIVVFGGVLAAQFGFENIVFAYLASAATAALLSSIQLRGDLKHAASLFFSRYV